MSVLLKALFKNTAGFNTRKVDEYVSKYVETAKIVEEVLQNAVTQNKI